MNYTGSLQEDNQTIVAPGGCVVDSSFIQNLVADTLTFQGTTVVDDATISAPILSVATSSIITHSTAGALYALTMQINGTTYKIPLVLDDE